jgi:hypothetical protein
MDVATIHWNCLALPEGTYVVQDCLRCCTLPPSASFTSAPSSTKTKLFGSDDLARVLTTLLDVCGATCAWDHRILLATE